MEDRPVPLGDAPVADEEAGRGSEVRVPPAADPQVVVVQLRGVRLIDEGVRWTRLGRVLDRHVPRAAREVHVVEREGLGELSGETRTSFGRELS